MKSFRKIISGVAIGVAVASSGAYSAQLEEIIVTAQKRAESLQDVAISMSAISGSKIEEAGLHSFGQLSAYVPNLTVTENAVNTIIGMRGVGIGANQSFEQSVGIYVDGVHYGKSRQVRTGLFDLQQVEVLRGPQGILFGKNTLAGAINVTSGSPTVGDEFAGKVSVSKESFGGQTIEGSLSGSLSDTFAVRFAYKDHQDDGFIDNTLTAGATFVGEPTATPYAPILPSTDERMWRLSAAWEPNDNTSVEFKHAKSDHTRIGGTALITTFSPLANIAASNSLMYGTMGAVFPQLGQMVASGVQDGFRDAITFGGCDLAAHMGRSHEVCENGGEMPEGTITSTEDTSLNIEFELANGYTFSSVTGMNKYEYEDGIDADWLPLRFIGRSDISDYDHTSQEFRITSPSEDKFSFVAGVYYDEQEQLINRLVTVDGTFGIPGTMPYILGAAPLDTFLFYPPAFTSAYGLPFALEGVTKFQKVGRISRWQQDTESWAVFFQGNYDLTDNLSLTAGLRYTEEDKTASALMNVTTSSTGMATPNPSPLLAGIMGASFASWDHDFHESRSTDQLMPAVSLEWTQSEDSMFYMSYSEGFKSGGFNAVDDQNPTFNADGTTNPTVPAQGFEYDDETASSIEIGGKHTLMDGAMTVNWAWFDSTYEDQQVSTFVGLGFVVTNAASTDVSGLEVDMTWQTTDNLRLGANFAIMEGEYGSYPGAGCTAAQASGLLGLGTLTASDGQNHTFDGCTAKFKGDGTQTGSGAQDLAGGQVGTDYNGSLTADYVRPLSNGVIWYTSVDVNFTAGYFMAGDMDPVDYHDGFEKVNVRTGLRGDNWNLMVYGKNVTDEITAQGAFDIPLAAGSHARYQTPGEVWGVRLSFDF
ncbi:MAG TPA: TonB-dependent receptor [Porticoccaceae bacterium]|nr:TonB-dependent receptor [Porticoccaceae bacterium]HIK79744.1 TonB-dependent receptor [Porticoccaceae bacterium]